MRFWEELLHVLSGRGSRHPRLPDLRDLPSRSVAVVGTQYLVNDAERRHGASRLYVLRVGSTRGSELATIEVFSNGRKLGRLARSVAAPLLPPLRGVGGAAVVDGTGTRSGGIRLWVDVPSTGAFETFAATWQESA